MKIFNGYILFSIFILFVLIWLSIFLKALIIFCNVINFFGSLKLYIISIPLCLFFVDRKSLLFVNRTALFNLAQFKCSSILLFCIPIFEALITINPSFFNAAFRIS